MTGPDLLAGALRLAAAGTPVFPCAPSKAPRTPHGLKDASTDPAQIAEWWNRWPDSLLGVPMGAVTGTAAIDLDVKNGARGMDWLEAHAARIPRTRRHRTRSGGAHLLLRLPSGIRIRNSASRIAPGVDVRGDGGYIIMPPSPGYLIEDEAEPADLPDWLLMLVQDQPKQAPALMPPVQHARPADMEGTRYGLAALDAECTAILNAPDGAKHDTLNRAAYSIAGLVAAGELAEGPALSALRSALAGIRHRCADFAAAERTLSDAWAAGLARPRTAPPPLPAPARREVVPPEPPPHAEPMSDAPSPSQEPRVPSRRSPLPRLRYGQIAPSLDATDFVQGLLNEQSSIVVYGESNSGKTFWTTDLALHVAAGKEWNGRRVEQGGVIYCVLEGGFGFRNRVHAWRQHHREEEEIPFIAIPAGLNLLDPEADTPRLIEAINAAAEDFAGPVKLVIIDTLSRALAGGNENAPDDMGALVTNMDAIRAATGAAVLFVHHSGKDAARGARGHSLLRAAIDTEIEVTVSGDETRKAEVVKQRELPKGQAFGFRLEVIELGRNRHAEPVTSCIVHPADAPTVRGAKELPAGAGPVLAAIKSLFAEGHGRAAQPFPHGPTIQAITLSTLRHRLIRLAWFRENHFREALPGALPGQRVLSNPGYNAEGKALDVLEKAGIIGKARPDGKRGDVLIWLNS